MRCFTKCSVTPNPGDVCVVGVARTPIGAFQGRLSSLSATELGAEAIREACRRAGVSGADVGEVVMGNVISTGLGQAPARQAALQSGLPQTVPCTVVNKVCASGLKAVMMAAQAVRCGAVQLVLAGGMESMSNVPHHLPSSRRGRRLGNMPLVDTLLTDGLTDSCGGGCWHMGRCADLCAQQHQISRSSQDDYAVESFRRAAAAASSGVTSWETASVPLPLAGRRGTVELVRDDEVPLKLDEAKLRRLPAAFAEPGPAAEHAVTAGNASALADGAAAVLLASTSYAERHGLPVLAHVEGMADAAQHPHWYTTAPELAARRALAAAGRAAADIDVWEVNEAFAVVALVNQQLLSVDVERLNVLGGSIALGHPIGASGARILVTLLNALRVRRGTLGVASICNGGGGASSVVVRAGPDLYSYTPPYASASQQLPCRPPAQ